MALRRLAATNAASVGSPGPRHSISSSGSTPASPGAPTTPGRTSASSYGYVRSPVTIPSQSSSVPFDWEAARTQRPAPFATPKRGGRKSVGTGTPSGMGATPRRVIRKKGIIERITDIPSRIAFEIALFPHNLPLPSAQTAAAAVGGLLHFLHLCVRVSQIRKVPDSEQGWEDMYSEDNAHPYIDWTMPATLLLLVATLYNVGRLFGSIKLYRMHQRKEPIASPRASWVSADLDNHSLTPPSILRQLRRKTWDAFMSSFRFLINKDHIRVSSPISGKMSRILQLELWMPGEFEMNAACVYSPVHFLLWMTLNSSNWYLVMAIMALTGIQMKVLSKQYEGLLKDKEIIAAEVMSEYNTVFVNPRINPIRKDVAVMTHESEIVNVWDD